ncbi:MAG: hypothetical protein Q9227_007024 [Pyrenula ochraceoflavens]
MKYAQQKQRSADTLSSTSCIHTVTPGPRLTAAFPLGAAALLAAPDADVELALVVKDDGEESVGVPIKEVAVLVTWLGVKLVNVLEAGGGGMEIEAELEREEREEKEDRVAVLVVVDGTVVVLKDSVAETVDEEAEEGMMGIVEPEAMGGEGVGIEEAAVEEESVVEGVLLLPNAEERIAGTVGVPAADDADEELRLVKLDVVTALEVRLLAPPSPEERITGTVGVAMVIVCVEFALPLPLPVTDTLLLDPNALLKIEGTGVGTGNDVPFSPHTTPP